jgi:hypothetical protein
MSAGEWGAASKAFDAEFGNWSVNEADKIITYKIEMSLVPNAVGTEDKESIISLDGDELKTVVTTSAGNNSRGCIGAPNSRLDTTNSERSR